MQKIRNHRLFITFLFGLIIFIDLTLLFRLWWHGYPKSIVFDDNGRFGVEPVSFQASDYCITILLIGLNIVLGYLCYRSWAKEIGS
jgi:hypothetical protein